MRGRRAGAVLTACAAALAATVTAGTPAEAAAGPMGRTTYVIAMMDGRADALAVRLATYVFAGDGTVTEKYWAWRQDAVSGKGNVRWTKPSSGYTTAGCRRACPVRTPYGFQHAPRTYRGHWTMASDDVLDITWSPTYPVERWHLDGGTPGIVGARLLSARGDAEGWGVGSDASATRGVSLAAVHATSGWFTGPFVENAYDAATRHLTAGFNTRDYSLCPGGRCLQGLNVTSADRRTWYHSYLAADPARDGRKVYWNNQTGVVQQLENPGTVCISASGGGHTNALLEALDDDGNFVGFVGVEASLNQRKFGQDVVAAYAMTVPAMLPALGAG